MAASLQSVREDVINGSTDFRSYIGEIKQNLLQGRTIHNVPGMGLDVAGNMIASVESRVGNLISNNLPNVKAAFGASLMTVMEYGVEYAKGIFGEENIALVAQKLSQGKAFIDEHSTEGQRKAYEYILGAGITNLAAKLVQIKPKLPDTLKEYFKSSPLKADSLSAKSKSKFVLFSDNPANAIDPLTSRAVLASAEEIAIAEQELKAYLELEKNTIKLQHDAEKLIKDAHLKQAEGASASEIIDIKFTSKIFNPYEIKESWMSNKNLTITQKELLQRVELYGKNPGNVTNKKGYLIVDTKLFGNEQTAQSIFEKLTGQKVPKILPSQEPYGFTLPDDTKIFYRDYSKFGNKKIEIDKRALKQNSLEKITFIFKENE